MHWLDWTIYAITSAMLTGLTLVGVWLGFALLHTI